jgi:hypothetical protein
MITPQISAIFRKLTHCGLAKNRGSSCFRSSKQPPALGPLKASGLLSVHLIPILAFDEVFATLFYERLLAAGFDHGFHQGQRSYSCHLMRWTFRRRRHSSVPSGLFVARDNRTSSGSTSEADSTVMLAAL